MCVKLCLSCFSSAKKFLLFPTALSGKSHYLQLILKEWVGVLSLPRGKIVYMNYLEFLCTGDLSLLPNLFIYSIIYCCQYRLAYYLFHTLGYNPPLIDLLYCLNCFSFGHWEFFQLVPVFLWHTSISVGRFVCLFFSTSLLYGTAGCSRLTLYVFSCFYLRISHFSKGPWFLLLENGIRNQDLDTMCAHCCGGSFLLHPLSWESNKIFVCILACIYAHIYKYFHM